MSVFREILVVRLSRETRSRLSAIVVSTFLTAVLVIWSLPLFIMISTSLKSQEQLYAYPPVWFPTHPMWSNYREALTAFLPFPIYFRNSAVVAICVVIGTLFSSSFVGYGFARIRFPGRDVLFIILLGTMMLPFAVRMIPLFLIFKELGWINKLYPLIVPSFFGTPLFIFLMRQFLMGMPDDLSDAALIDGCSHLGIWWHIMLPLSKPCLTAVGVLAFQHSWNDFFAPLIFIDSQNMRTVPLGLYTLIGSEDVVQSWQYLMAASVAASIPVVILFAFAQRFFIQGVTLSALKG